MPRAYNRYEYETSPKKLEPYYAPKKKETNDKNKKIQKSNTTKKQQEATKLKVKIMMILFITFAILFAITFRNAQIDESFEKVQTLKTELATLEKENAQLEVSIESSLNLTNLEQQARNILGMQKLTNKQTEYVSLPKTDYIEVAAEQVVIEENNGIINKICNYLSKLFK